MLLRGAGVWEKNSAEGLMPLDHRAKFFASAQAAAAEASQQLHSSADSDTNYNGVILFIVTDDETILQESLEGVDQDALNAAADVVAITSPKGEGTQRLLTELQQMWLLGFGDVILTTPGSARGVFGHARLGKNPMVVLGPQQSHVSTTNQPCLAQVGLLQQARCFQPSMLSLISYDPIVPC